MSYVSDALRFELFHGKDLWKRLKKDPKRLLLGVDPWSTKIWNKVLGRDDEPLVDQLGGAYGGHTLSVGQLGPDGKPGGVYGRAQDAGINIGPASDMQGLAHLIAASYGAQGLMGIGGGGGAPAGEPAYGNMWQDPETYANMPRPSGQPQQRQTAPAYVAMLQMQQMEQQRQEAMRQMQEQQAEMERMIQQQQARRQAVMSGFSRMA